MIITLSWLKNHLDTKANIKTVVEKLTSIGLEVEGIKENFGELGNFKIAKVLKAEKHPNADKLKLCDVSLGDGKILKVEPELEYFTSITIYFPITLVQALDSVKVEFVVPVPKELVDPEL